MSGIENFFDKTALPGSRLWFYYQTVATKSLLFPDFADRGNVSATGATDGKLAATGAIGGNLVVVVEKLVAIVKKLVAAVENLVAVWSKT